MVVPFLGALFVGACMITPHIFAAVELGEDYRGYPFLFQANEDLYMARTQEVIDGHFAVGSPMLFEYKNQWPQVLPSGEWVYALPSLLLGTSLVDTILIAKFFLPATLFLLVYTLTLSLLHEKDSWSAIGTAVATGFAVTLGYDIVDYRNIIPLLSDSFGLLLPVWTRPVNPIVGAVLLFSILIISWRTYDARSHWSFLVGAIILGAMIGYFFSWALGCGIVGLLMLFSLYEKNIIVAGRLAAILGLSVILQIPHWYHTLKAFGSNAGHATALKNGAIFTHNPIINKFVLATTVVFVVFAYLESRKRGSLGKQWWFCIAVIVTLWVVFSQQIITGMTIWPYHFVQYTIPLGMVVLLVSGHTYLSRRFPSAWKSLILLSIIISCTIEFASIQTYDAALPEFKNRQTYMPIFTWLNTHAQKDCVVLVHEESDLFAVHVPAFTHCNTYTTTYTPFGVPEERRMHSLLVILRMRDIHPENIRSYLESNPGMVNGYLYDTIAMSISSAISDKTRERIDEVVPLYKEFYEDNFLNSLNKYRVDYLVTKDSDAPQNLPLRELLRSGELILYSINP